MSRLVERLREPIVKTASDGKPYSDHRNCAALRAEAADALGQAERLA